MKYLKDFSRAFVSSAAALVIFKTIGLVPFISMWVAEMVLDYRQYVLPLSILVVLVVALLLARLLDRNRQSTWYFDAGWVVLAYIVLSVLLNALGN